MLVNETKLTHISNYGIERGNLIFRYGTVKEAS